MVMLYNQPMFTCHPLYLLLVEPPAQEIKRYFKKKIFSFFVFFLLLFLRSSAIWAIQKWDFTSEIDSHPIASCTLSTRRTMYKYWNDKVARPDKQRQQLTSWRCLQDRRQTHFLSRRSGRKSEFWFCRNHWVDPYSATYGNLLFQCMTCCYRQNWQHTRNISGKKWQTTQQLVSHRSLTKGRNIQYRLFITYTNRLSAVLVCGDTLESVIALHHPLT